MRSSKTQPLAGLEGWKDDILALMGVSSRNSLTGGAGEGDGDEGGGGEGGGGDGDGGGGGGGRPRRSSCAVAHCPATPSHARGVKLASES